MLVLSLVAFVLHLFIKTCKITAVKRCRCLLFHKLENGYLTYQYNTSVKKAIGLLA